MRRLAFSIFEFFGVSPSPGRRRASGQRPDPLWLILLALTISLPASATVIESVSHRGRNVVKRYVVDGQPAGVALGPDGLLYVGMANEQSVVVIDPKTDQIVREEVLDDPEIAATKELVTMRIDGKRGRLVIGQGSDESVTILTLPELEIEREITLEGEMVRDAVPDPMGRYLFVLGRDVHIFNAGGDEIIRTVREVDPMAIAVSSDGSLLAVIGSEEFSAGKATVVSLWNLSELEEVSREPLQTDRTIRAATFAAGDLALAVLADDWLAEKPIGQKAREARMVEDDAGRQRISFQFGDLVSSESVCLADAARAQAIATNRDGTVVYFPEKRCGESGSFVGSKRNVKGASLYAVDARAIARDPETGNIWATDPAGTITLYRAPE